MTLSQPSRLTRIFQKDDPPLYFMTLCTDNRRNILENKKVHAALLEYAQAGVARGVALGRYVIMTDHIHLFVQGSHNFDHVIRNTESYSQKWDYVRENPVRAGLASAADEWPFQGEIVRIEHR